MDAVTKRTAAFPMPPEGMFTDQRDFVALRLVLGLMHPESADGVRVVAWDGETLRHLTSDAARKWAAEIEPIAALSEVREAIIDLADGADARNAAASAAKYELMCQRAARLAMMTLKVTSDVAGRA